MTGAFNILGVHSIVWGGGRMVTCAFTCPSLYDLAWNDYQTCHYESNHCYQCWMCSAWVG